MGAAAVTRCTFGLHAWRGGKRANTAPEPFSLEPVVGSRVCARCGKRQVFSWDSQGGMWVTQRQAAPEQQ
jgi:hypothetical protein